MLTKQEAYAKAYRGLAGQGWKRSYKWDEGACWETCLYNGPEGRRCALGWLAGEKPWPESYFPLNVAIELGAPELEDFLWAMRRVHDTTGDVALQSAFERFGREQGLEIPQC